jgi:CHAT domain-containing protein
MFALLVLLCLPGQVPGTAPSPDPVEQRLQAARDALLSRVGALQASAERALGAGDKPLAMRAFLTAGKTALAAGEAEAAREPLRRSLELAEQLRAGPIALEIELLLAIDEGLAGKHALGLAALRKLQPLIEDQAGAVELEGKRGLFFYMLLALLHDGLGDAQLRLEGVHAALPHYRRAAYAAALSDWLAQDLGIAPILAVNSWCKLADALGRLGRDAEAEQALVACEDAAGEEGRSVHERAQALLARARSESIRGEAPAAQSHALEALALEQGAEDPRASLRGEILGALSAACRDLGVYEEALAYLDELGKLVEAQHLEAFFGVSLHRARAVLHCRLNDTASAQAEIELARETARTLGQGEGLIETCIDAGLIRAQTRIDDRVQHEYAQAIELATKQGNRRLEAQARLALANLEAALGHPEDAERTFAAVVRIADELGDPRQRALAEVGQGQLALERGDRALAARFSGSAAARLESLGLAEAALDARATLARLALEQRDVPALAEQIEVARRWTLDGPRAAHDPLLRSAHRARFAGWSALEQSLVELELAAVPEKDQPAIVRRGLEFASGWKGRSLLDELSTRAAGPALQTRLDLSAGCGWLRADAALLEFAESRSRLLLYVLRREGIQRLDLGPLEALRLQAARFTARMADRDGAPEGLPQEAHALWKALLERALAGLPASTRRLVIVPTAGLAGVPFDALVLDPRPGSGAIPGEPHCVIDDYLVCRLPTSPLLRLLAERPPRAASASRTLIVGDAIYPAELREASGRELADLRRLTQSRGETLHVADQLLSARPEEAQRFSAELSARRNQRDVALEAGSFDLYLGAEARAERLRGDLRRYSDIHLTLHAIVALDDPAHTGLVLSGDGLRARLFDLSDAMRARLDADLVCLAACSTARGPVFEGEGVASLAYAFLMAGSRAVIGTLWTLDDLDAIGILGPFVTRRLSDSMHPALALREARQDYRRGLARGENAEVRTPRWAPYHWAGCVYFGALP